MAAFASATFVTLLGTGVAAIHGGIWVHKMAGLGLLLGFFGAGGLVLGCANLFRATRLSLVNICDEAALIREAFNTSSQQVKNRLPSKVLPNHTKEAAANVAQVAWHSHLRRSKVRRCNKYSTQHLKMKMKLKINVLSTRCLCLFSLCGMLATPLQNASAQSDQDLIEVARSVVGTDRKAVVVAAMELTDDEAKDFWPLYREYRSAMDKITDDRVKLVLDYAKVYPNVPEDQAKEMLNTYTSLEQRQVEKRNAYIKKFSKILPADKALRFAQVETRLDVLVHLNLAARIPLTPIADPK